MISLPIDIQVLILPCLTSSSLISLSQTNRHLRQLISPARKQFLNRLLELECLPEYGGEVTINEHAKIITPSETVSYACAHCLKIVPHTRFDNHALLRLRFRKPPPESRASQQLCGWTSGDAKARGLKRQAELRNDSLGNWMLQNSSSGIAESRLRELYIIGTTRNRRMCNECKFITGFWARNAGIRSQSWRGKHRNSNVGTATVPVVKGRQRRCHDSTERYFWGLFPNNADTEYPRRSKIYRAENCDWWTLWSIRCPGCAMWQERASFRKGGGYGVKATPADPDEWRQAGWDGPRFGEWRCNRCLETTVGEEELGTQLLAFWKRLAEFEISTLNYLLPAGCYGVDALKDITEKICSWGLTVATDSVTSQLLRSIPTSYDFANLDGDQRRFFYRSLKRWFNNLDKSAEGLGSMADRDWFKGWGDEYEIVEKRIKDLETYTEILEADPGKLVRFVLNGYAALV